jgi:hypothetical protein
MKKNLLLCLIHLFTFTAAFAQPCIPTTDTIPGIEPDTLSPAYANVMYEEVMQFVMPSTTFFVFGEDTIIICIDSLVIESVNGLPDGFTYSCNNPVCSVPGGGSGCATITGNPVAAQAGYYPLEVDVKIYTSDCISFPLLIVDSTVTLFYIEILEGLGEEALNPFSSLHVSVFPNPSPEEFTVSYSLNRPQEVVLSVFNLVGKLVERKRLNAVAGSNAAKIKTSQLHPGSYFLELKTPEGTALKKITVAEE